MSEFFLVLFFWAACLGTYLCVFVGGEEVGLGGEMGGWRIDGWMDRKVLG
jgi:hypothetical protein